MSEYETRILRLTDDVIVTARYNTTITNSSYGRVLGYKREFPRSVVALNKRNVSVLSDAPKDLALQYLLERELAAEVI